MKAVLVGIQGQGVSEAEFSSSLAELQRLVETLGFEVIGSVTQKRQSPSPATAIGAGKLLELASWTGGTGIVPKHETPKSRAAERAEEEEEELETEEPTDDEGPPAFPPQAVLADKVIFDQELTPNQLVNLQQATNAEVLDRTGVIIEIFHRHAKTQEARYQVEIARLKYLSPRLRLTGPSERQGGGIGAKGVGETTHELGRRRIRDRVAELQRELETLHANRGNRRQRRGGLCRVALVGYTNAGKSSLMRKLTGSEVLVANKLFATLDTTVRTLQPDQFPKVLVSDTVGFIQKLPHDLVASFRSTLDEAAEASLILFVVDASDPTFREQLKVTQTVLAEIDGADIPSRLVLNKSDLLGPLEEKLLRREFPDALLISTLDADDIKRVKASIRDFATADMEEVEFLVRYDDKSSLLGNLRRHALILKETHEEEGVRLLVRTYPETLEKLKKVHTSF